jgi:DNA-binding PucR family transcriptional regulator
MGAGTALLGAIAERVEDELEPLVDEMVEAIVEVVPAFDGDAVIRLEVAASCRGNARRFLAMAARGETGFERAPVDVPPEALDVARTVVRRGIESDAIYHGYRQGQQVLWRRWMTAAEHLAPSKRELVATLDLSLAVLFRYVDEVVVRVVAEMQHERDQVLGGALARRAETIRLLLDGAPIGQDAVAQRLGIDLARHHTAAVLWSDRADLDGGALETAAVALAQAVGARPPLMLAAGVTTLWAWITTDAPIEAPEHLPAPGATRRTVPTQPARSAPGAPAPAGPTASSRADAVTGAPSSGVRVAIGPTLPGALGFRRSHGAAQAMHRLLAAAPGGAPVTTYAELEITTLAAGDEDRAADFVRRTLGPLAEDDATANRLRETLRVFLDEAENAPRAAARLHAHRNTVLQRVARATALLGYAPGERRLAVELALELRRRLGPPRSAGGPS